MQIKTGTKLIFYGGNYLNEEFPIGEIIEERTPITSMIAQINSRRKKLFQLAGYSF